MLHLHIKINQRNINAIYIKQLSKNRLKLNYTIITAQVIKILMFKVGGRCQNCNVYAGQHRKRAKPHSSGVKEKFNIKYL